MTWVAQERLQDDLLALLHGDRRAFPVDACQSEVDRRGRVEVAPPGLAVCPADLDTNLRPVDGVLRDQSVPLTSTSSDVLHDGEATPQPRTQPTAQERD